MAVVDELITLLGLQTDSSVKSESGKYNKALGSMTETAAQLAKGVIAAQAAITGFVAIFAAATDEGGKFAKQNNITFESLQELEFAASRAGGSAAELRGDITKLAEEFGNLGPADQTLLNIAERMEGLGKIEQLQLGKALGLSEGTIRLLQEGRSGIESLRKEARGLGLVLSEDTAKKAAKFQDQLTNLKGAVLGIGGAIAAGLLPELTSVTEGITEFVMANQDIIKSGIGQVVGGISMGFGLLGDAISFLLSLLPEFQGELDATKVIAVAVAGAVGILAANMLIAAAPFIAIGLAIAGVILILEDLWTAFQGGESIIGGFIDDFGERFPALAQELGLVFEDISRAFGAVIDFFVDGFKLIVKGWNLIGSIVGGAVIEGLDDLNADLTMTGQQVAQVPASVVNGTANSNSQTDSRTLNMTVNGAGSPDQVAKGVIEKAGFASAALGAVPSGGG